MNVTSESFQEFTIRHKNKANIIFHIICGFIYTALFLYLLGGWYFILLYTMFLVTFYPQATLLFIVMSSILLLLNNIIESTKINYKSIIALIIVFYILPEVSHWITQEKTA